jgi:type 1 glutamine amidotransferase
MRHSILLLCSAALFAQQQPATLTPEQKQQLDAAMPAKAPAKPKKPRRLLVISLAKVQDRIVRGHPAIPAGMYALEEMGKRTGAWEATLSNDLELFSPGQLKQFDAVCFNNTQGVLFDDAERRSAFETFVKGGGGVVGFHAAIATFVQHPVYDQWPWFGRMLGGTENGGHPWMPTDSYTVKIDDPKSPLTAVFGGKAFEVNDEVMQLQEPNLRDRLRVLLSIDMEKSKPSRGMLPVRQQDRDFPLTWIRAEEKGRVFTSGMGHNANVFFNPQLLQHFLAGIQFALGDLDADATPSAKLTSK